MPEPVLPRAAPLTVFELQVRNHPGTMSHLTGLFARRAFNLEAILCVPNAGDGGATSTVLLGVVTDPRLEQVESQLGKLHDVLAVQRRSDLDTDCFDGLLASLKLE